MKKTIGIALLVIGIIVGIIGFAKQSDDNEILKVGKVEIKKDASKNINAMMIAGIAATVGGIIVLAVGGKN